jgi:acetylserotonin N-methyltransferase
MNDSAPIIELIYAYRRSKTMFAALSLGVFDRLHEGPARPADFGLREDTAERLLDACVSLGLVEKDGARYRNTAVADRYLARKSPDTMAGYILYSNSALFPMWSDLEGALREGTPRWEPVFGFPPGGLFEHFFRTDEQKRDFLSGMHGFGRITSDAVVSAFDLSRFRRFVDLGGGTGHLPMAAAARYPGMRTAVFDLAAAVEFAREFVDDRVELIAGDFFRDTLPQADLYGVGRILHDWGEDKIRLLLDRIYKALPPGGGLLIAEILLDDDKRGPVDGHMQSLNMLVCTEGRERSLSEYRVLLEAAGFTNVQGHRTGTPLDAVLALRHNTGR